MSDTSRAGPHPSLRRPIGRGKSPRMSRPSPSGDCRLVDTERHGLLPLVPRRRGRRVVDHKRGSTQRISLKPLSVGLDELAQAGR